MKKISTTITALFLLVITTFAQQNFGGTPPNCTLPAGYILSQGDRITTYQNPLNNCKDDCGILTPGVGGNNPGNIVFPAENYKPTLLKQFSLFIFDANLRCESNKDFQCPTFVTLYIVPASYNSVQAPSAADNYGESKQFLLYAKGKPNTVYVDFSKAPEQGKQYRVFLDFGKGTTCVQQNTKYIIDILPDPATLPVNLSSFLAGRTGSDVSLNWKTEIEMNAVNFDVQRSYTNTSFSTIATVAGITNGSSSKSFSYLDNSNTSTSTSYYRLKIVKQGEVTYSDIRTVKGFSGKAALSIYPNPSVANSKITITELTESARVQLLDNSGRVVKTIILNNSNTVDLNGLGKGTYLVRIIGSVSGKTEIRKLTVIN